MGLIYIIMMWTRYTSMLKPMPVGQPEYGELILKNLFGFFYARIEAPNMNIPVLPIKR